MILDVELAELYGVPTKALNQAVKRNPSRFPEDFMFPLSNEEKAEVVTICDHLPNLKFSRTLPNVFTEYGAIMAANVLNSESAVEMSIHVIRTFVRLREAERLLMKHDLHLAGVITKLRELSSTTKPKKVRKIGFVVPEQEEE